MKTLHYYLYVLFFLLIVSCGQKPLDPDKPVYVTIKTTMGDVTVLLYDDTPLHKENFIRLCQADEYKGMIFHRIIKDFVVQGGDPDSKELIPGKLYGDSFGGYTVPAEILPHYFNKRGALIDAKEVDAENPERASAGTQFCFIQGKVFTDAELDQIEVRINSIRRNWLYYKIKADLQKENPELASEEMEATLEEMISIQLVDILEELGTATIPPERREIYKTIGGSPHLDGSVTIFGEVVQGLDVVERMSLVGTDQNDRPLKNVIIQSTRVFQK